MPQSKLSQFLAASPCPFAQTATVPKGCIWSEPGPTPERLDQLTEFLSRFSADPTQDVCALEIHRDHTLESITDAGRLLHSILRGLRKRDTSLSRPLIEGIEDPSWDFEFQGLAYFISFFGSFYPSGHSRHSSVDGVSFLLFQPERAFRRFGVSSRRPDRAGLSRRVHQLFTGKGKSYDLDLNLDVPKSFRYLKPIGHNEPPVAWWRDL